MVLWVPPPVSYVRLPGGDIARPWDPSGEYVDLWPMRVPAPEAWKWTPQWKDRHFRRAATLSRFTRALLLLLVAAMLVYEWYFLVSVCCAFALRFA